MNNSNSNSIEHSIELAEVVRQACIEAARTGYREASMSGLCAEGAAEAAVGSIQSLDLEKLIRDSGA